MVDRVTNSLDGTEFDFDAEESVAIGHNRKLIYLLRADYDRIKETQRFKDFWL